MSLILNNSRDINNKFLFGHWMMRKKNGQLPFVGPGFGRILYWPIDDLEGVEKDMIEMKKQKLKCYSICLTGPVRTGDKCWNCCAEDEVELMFTEDDAPVGEITWPENTYGHYFGRDGTYAWINEVKEKYKKLLKLCRKYNMWLLVFVVNHHIFDPETYEIGGAATTIDRWLGWIEDFPNSDIRPGSSSEGDRRPDLSRRKELRMGINNKHHYLFGFNCDLSDPHWGPTIDELKDFTNKVLLSSGGQERVLVCPIDEIPKRDSEIAEEFEAWCINKAKGRGFATCVYSEDNEKRGARMCQGGHQDSIEEASCPKEIAVSDNDIMLITEIYPDEEAPEEGEGGEEEGGEEPGTGENTGGDAGTGMNTNGRSAFREGEEPETGIGEETGGEGGEGEAGEWADYVYSIYEIPGDKQANVENVTTLITNYKVSNAKAAILYGVNYGKGGHVEVDTPAIDAIKTAWYG